MNLVELFNTVGNTWAVLIVTAYGFGCAVCGYMLHRAIKQAANKSFWDNFRG